jgi:hypothetical protein
VSNLINDELGPSIGTSPMVPLARIGDANGEVVLDNEGIELFGDAVQYKDLTFNFVGRKLYSNQGTIDMDWDKNALKFQKGGDLADKNNRIQGSETYNHEFKFSTSSSDLITIKPHFHWQQYNDTDQYEVSYKWRILTNTNCYMDDGSDWTTATVKTCDGHDLKTFSLESGKDFMVQLTEFPDITAHIDLSSEIQVMITRIDNNSFTKDLYMLRFDFHCPTKALGTKHELND